MRNNNKDESKSVTVKLAQPRYIPPPLPKPVKVIGSLYCAPYPVDLTMVNMRHDYVIDNASHNIIFRIKEAFFTLRRKRVLVDSACNPIVTMQAKTITDSSRWQVYKGDSTDDNDLLFSVQKSSVGKSSWTDLDVFLAANTKENMCDFKIKGTDQFCSSILGMEITERSCVVCLGHSSVNIAQMHKIRLNRFSVVNVNPHVDYAFIIALMDICQLINWNDFTNDTISSHESKKSISSCESKDNISCESEGVDRWKCD